MNILSWNCRGINYSSKRQRLRDIIVDNQIDIVAIQETKKENFTTRQLKTISNHLDLWLWLPSVGRSGAILFGGDSNKISILTHTMHRFCLNITLECKQDQTVW